MAEREGLELGFLKILLSGTYRFGTFPVEA
jgi:hypothetical protein